MLVAIRLQVRLKEQITCFNRHFGMLLLHILQKRIGLFNRFCTCNAAIPQNALVNVGQIIVSQVRAPGNVHRNIGKRRRQNSISPIGSKAFARILHRLSEHLREQVKTNCAHLPTLLGTQNVARAANFQVTHGNAHAASQFLMLVYGKQTRRGFFGEHHFLGIHEIRVRLRARAAHTAFQLVHLRQAKTLRVLDDERIRVRIINAAFDDGRGNQHIQLARRELFHHVLKLLFCHFSMRHAHARLACRQPHALNGIVDSAHAIRNVIYLSPARQLVTNSA